MENDELVFHKISLADKGWIDEKLKYDDYAACEYTFANNFIWRKVYQAEVGQAYGCGVFRYQNNGRRQYSYPFGGGDKKSVIKLLMQKCADEGVPLSIYPIMEKERDELLKDFPGEFLLDTNRDNWDYVYTVEKLTSLQGHKLHGKRNHIARFMDDADWSYDKLGADDIDECRKMAQEWIGHREEKWNSAMDKEIAVLGEALQNFDALGLIGGVLRKKGEIVAFTVGERLNSDTLVVHFEKAFPELQGAYPMINQQFVINEGGQYTYVNREDDTGDLGLRKAKLSYVPDILLKKYEAVQSRVVYANKADSDSIREIWQTCFGDSREYIDNYLRKRFTDENMLVIYADKKPVAMASFLHVLLTVKGEKRKARYLYAVATLPEYRRKGFATSVIRFGSEKYGVPLVLCPASEELKEYYSEIGFREAFFKSGRCKNMTPVSENIDDINIRAREENAVKEELRENAGERLGEWQVSEPSAEIYKKLRDSYFEQECYVEWDAAAVGYAIDENRVCGGRTLMLSRMMDEAVPEQKLLMYRRGAGQGELCIVEMTLEKAQLDEIAPALLKKTNCDRYVINHADGMILFPQGEEWDCESGYLGLTLG